MPRLLPLILAAMTLPGALALADDDYGGGHFFDSFGYAGLLIENGQRDGHEGMGVSAYGEGMMLGLVTQLGHRAGLEGSAEVGWAGFTAASENTHFGKRGPMHFDLSVGFPVALLQFGNGGAGAVRLQVAPGMGLGILHAYGYLRGRLTVGLPRAFALDLSYRWTPSRASYAWEDGVGLSAARLRLSLHGEVGELSLLLWAELAQAKTEVFTVGPLHPVERAPYQNLLRLGAGWVF